MSTFDFHKIAKPCIYAYTDIRYRGQIKVGYTTKTAEERVKEQQENVKMPYQSWEIVLEEPALRDNGTLFTDHEIHKRLEKMGIRRTEGEWFECGVEEVMQCIIAERKGIENNEKRLYDFPMRPEQREAVEKTANFFRKYSYEKEGFTPHFLWNAKMRFGKTFAAYQLAKEMGWRKLLVLTFKPAVQSAWREDLLSHIDFKGWQFSSNKKEDTAPENLDKKRPFVFFASFQDILGEDKNGGIAKPKDKNEWLHKEDWDCIIFDEYHYGAWREKARKRSGADIGLDTDAEDENKEYLSKSEKENSKDFVKDDHDSAETLEGLMPLSTRHYLYLSGTPFRSISTGEFLEDSIYSWTYTDEQKAKENWDYTQGANPYLSLPRMVMLTYQLPEKIRQIATKGDFNEFDLNLFFKAKGEGEKARFEYENEVQKWLLIIRSEYSIEDDLKLGKNKPAMPFSDTRLLGALQHTLWFLPNVASCYAMANLLKQKQNAFFHDYNIIVCAGNEVGVGENAFTYMKDQMGNPFKTKSITLSCGKLTTGVSVPPWSGVFMLRSVMSPESYFQTIFRAQTPWVAKNPNRNSPHKEEIIKHECYVFDFAPNRALKQVASYSQALSVGSMLSAEEKVKEFTRFLPVLAYIDGAFFPMDSEGILNYAYAGTTGLLLARRWQSAMLVNVDNNTLTKLINNPQAMEALQKIEDFRNLNKLEIENVVNQSKEIKEAKTKTAKGETELTPEDKKELSEKEKEVKSKRREIQEKLIKFATRIPIFMYLSEYREQSLRDVITKLEPELFVKVTGITQDDFALLEKIGVFNGNNMDMAVLGFKRYEDSSLNYTGIDRHQDETMIGTATSVVPKSEVSKLLGI